MITKEINENAELWFDDVRAIGAALEARLALTDSPMRAEATA